MSETVISTQAPWGFESLGDLCDILIGRTPSRNRLEYWGKDHPWLSIADMNQGREIRTTKERISHRGASASGSRLIPRNTVLLSFKLSIGKVAVSEIDLFTNEAIAALPIRDPQKLHRDYLFWCLRSIRLDKEVDVAAKGRTLNSKKLARLKIPLPNLDEQRRIAAVLDKADALRRQRRESLELTEKLVQSVFIEMFGDPVTNPKGLPLLELGRFGIVQTGNTPPRSNKANYAKTGLEWIKTDNIVEDTAVVTTSLERLSKAGAQLARVAPAGSLLVACIAGSEKSIGRAALTDREVAFNQQINSITPHADTSPLFLYFLVKIARRQIQMAAAKGMKKMINKSTFEGLRFIAPIYGEQLKFERVAERLIGQRKGCQDQLLHLERFFSSLQQWAFRGKLELSRVWLEEEVETLERAANRFDHLVNVTMPGAFGGSPMPRALRPSVDVYHEIKLRDAELKEGGSIAWSPDYLRYRIIPSLTAPFNFDDLMTKVRKVFKEPPYDAVRDLVLELLGDNEKPPALRQYFDHAVNKDTNEITGSRRMLFDFIA